MKTWSSLLSVFVTLPIWYYLIFSILVAINASQLQWFLYWVYVPVGLFVAVATKLVQDQKNG